MTQTRTLALTALAAALLAPLPVAAQSQLERMEVLFEQTTAMVNAAMVVEIPALEGNMPDPAWDEPMRAAHACLLDGFVEASSEAAVDTMLNEMEAAMADGTFETFMNGAMSQAVQLPDGLDQARAQVILLGCGVMELITARLVKSGAMEIMMQQ